VWTLESQDAWDRRLKQYAKKCARELAAALDNLDTFHKTLNTGVKPREAKFGFIHPEPLGVLAIDQKGGGPSLAQIRLYVYPDEDREVLHLLTLGDKNSQTKDIVICKDYVAQLRKREGHGHESKEEL
jgi:hypothetical protein